MTGNSCRSKSSGTLDRSTDVSKHRTAFTFRVKQFKESCLTLNKRTAILRNAGKSLPDLTVSHSTSLQSLTVLSVCKQDPHGGQPITRNAGLLLHCVSSQGRCTISILNVWLELSLAAGQIFVFGVCNFTEYCCFIKRKTILTRTVTGEWILEWGQRDNRTPCGLVGDCVYF